MRDGVSLSGQKRKQPLVSYTQIMQLPNLSAYLQLPQDFPVTKVAFKYLNLPVNQSAFVDREYAEVAEAINVVEVSFTKAELANAENTIMVAHPDAEPKLVFPKSEGGGC
jgi:type IV secretory pathway TraG/TraD family ATPase VirD4